MRFQEGRNSEEVQDFLRTHRCEVELMAAGMGVIEEVGESVRTMLARFTQGMKQGQRVVGAPWPSAEGEGAQRLGLRLAAAALHLKLASLMAPWPLSMLCFATCDHHMHDASQQEFK